MAKFIAIEGIDGAGKTTVIKHIKTHLGETNVLYTREPGGTPLGDEIRTLLKRDMEPETELLLISAARAQHVHEVIAPALARGIHVITDRFVASSYAYQIHGRDMRYAEGLMAHISSFICIGGGEVMRPNLSILLSVDPEIGLRRDTASKEGIERFEEEGIEFLRNVQEGYKKYFAHFPPRHFKEVDAGKPEEDVKKEVLDIVQERLLR